MIKTNRKLSDLELWEKYAIRIKINNQERWISGTNFELKYIEKSLKMLGLINVFGIPIKGKFYDSDNNRPA